MWLLKKRWVNITISILDQLSTTERCWRFINPPAKGEDLIRKRFAFIYTVKKVQYLYIGKVMMRFLSDAVEDKRFTVACQMDCLRQKFGVTDNLLREHGFPTKDVGKIPAKDFIAGPLHGIYKDGGKWEFPAYASEFRPLFEQSKKNEREKIYFKYASKLRRSSYS